MALAGGRASNESHFVAMTAIAQQTGLSRESLYRAFSKRGNPTVATLSSVLAATGLRLSVLPA